MDNQKKKNDSYFTDEAKKDIKELLDLDDGSEVVSELEATGGLTLGKGTEDETSLTAAKLKQMKSTAEDRIYSVVRYYNSAVTIGANASHNIQLSNIPDSLSGHVRPGLYVPVCHGSYTTNVWLPVNAQAGAFRAVKVNEDGTVQGTNDFQTYFDLTNDQQYNFEIRNNTSASVIIPIGYLVVISFVSVDYVW